MKKIKNAFKFKFFFKRLNEKILLKFGKDFLIFFPFLWHMVLFLYPFLLIVKISFSKIARSVPPYTKLIFWKDQEFTLTINFENYIQLIKDSLYFSAYFESFKIATISTFICLLIAYPLAWNILRIKSSLQNFFLLLIIVSSWIPFLIRIYSLIGLLNQNGIVNQFLIYIGITKRYIQILYTETAMYIGLVYCYLPFMVLPIYSELKRLNYSLVEASFDLGMHPLKTFFKIVLPSTKNGIFAGCILVFIPILGEYMIPELLGGSKNIMIGRIIWQEFFSNHDWPVASSVAVTMLLLLIFPIIWLYKYQRKTIKRENE